MWVALQRHWPEIVGEHWIIIAKEKRPLRATVRDVMLFVCRVRALGSAPGGEFSRYFSVQVSHLGCDVFKLRLVNAKLLFICLDMNQRSQGFVLFLK